MGVMFPPVAMILMTSTPWVTRSRTADLACTFSVQRRDRLIAAQEWGRLILV